MTGRYIIAGSRDASDGHFKNAAGRWTWDKERSPAILAHNLQTLDAAIRASGFHTRVANLHTWSGPGIKVCRGTPFGNPFTHLDGPTLAKFKVGSRAEAIERYKDWFMEQPELIDRLPELRGKTLLCYCAPKSCHGDYLAECAGRIEVVVSGTAHGADKLGEIWAKENGISIDPHPADWNGPLGLGAGYARNAEMALVADGAVILWNGASRGTKSMIDLMQHAGKEVYVQRVRIENHLTYPI